MSAVAHNPIVDACECEDCRFWEAMEPTLAKFRDTRERREAQGLYKAIVLATSLEVCEALLRGEAVPKASLEPTWRKAYGI